MFLFKIYSARLCLFWFRADLRSHGRLPATPFPALVSHYNIDQICYFEPGATFPILTWHCWKRSSQTGSSWSEWTRWGWRGLVFWRIWYFQRRSPFSLLSECWRGWHCWSVSYSTISYPAHPFEGGNPWILSKTLQWFLQWSDNFFWPKPGSVLWEKLWLWVHLEMARYDAAFSSLLMEFL